MSGSTSPAASPIALPVAVAPPSANAPGVPSLAAFIDLMIGKIAPPAPKAASGDGKRQDDAASGNALPEKEKNIDPALAWLFGAAAVPAPQPANAAPLSLPSAFGAVAPDAGLVPATPEGKPDATAPSNQDIADAKPLAFTPPITKAAPQPISLSPNPAPAGAVLPALFALSMTDRTARDNDALSSLASATTALAQPTATMPVAPMGDAQRQTLDLGRQDWPQKMIDHIEALRDNANANDTSIRLKPEALGRVDIALRTHDGGAISVRFTAEQPTTRTLLVDAAPQLAAAAEARGIRLSGTSVDLGGQGDQRPQPQADRAQPITNRLADPRGDDNQAVDDGRIA